MRLSYRCEDQRLKYLSSMWNHKANRCTRSSLTANSRTKRWPSACRREMASRICGAYPVLERANEAATVFQVSSSVTQLEDWHRRSKTLAGVSIAITGMPDRTAEQTRKPISNAVPKEKWASVGKVPVDKPALTFLNKYLFCLLPLFACISRQQ